MNFIKRILFSAIAIFFHLFLFAQPTLNSFSPVSGPIGTPVTITGTNFNVTAANNFVYFGAVRAIVTVATSTTLIVTVPNGASQQPISVTSNNLTAYSTQPFIVTYSGGGTLTGRSYEQAVNISTSPYPYDITFGDFDNDGKPDAATVNNSNVPASFVSVHRNTGSSGNISFDPQINLPIGDFGYGITSADFDGDGKLDLAGTCLASNGNVSIYRNNSSIGNINFATSITYAAGNSPYTVVSGDIDRDGKPDLIICNYFGNTISVLRNTSTVGNISFAPRLTFNSDLAPYDLAVGDLDGDGKLDVVTSNQLSNNVSAFRNTSTVGSISFATRVDYLAGTAPLGITIGDLDGDNKPEVAFVNNGNYTVSVLRNTSNVGSFSFAPRKNFSLSSSDAVGPRRVAISDLDADSKPDLIVAGSYLYALQNNSTTGTISFAPYVTYFSFSPYRICLSDLDMDGKPDVAVSNVSGQTFSVFRNRVPAPQVSSLLPTIGASGAAIVINGYNLAGTTAVQFGDVPATSYTINNANTISGIVGSGSSGYVKVTTAYGSDSLSGFIFAGPPVISSISATSGTTGDTIIITGQNFTGATAVNFGGTTASYFTIASASIIKAVVGSGSSGSISVTTPYGTGSFVGFTYVPIPAITSFSPATAATGNSVTVTGRNFTSVTSVLFGGIPAGSFTVLSPNTINAVVGNGASGNVSVTNNFGTGILGGFTYLSPPTISSFTPTSAGSVTTVTITGVNFVGTTAVKFGATNASSFTVVSPTVITAIVGSGASGSISVTNEGGTVSLPGFTFVPQPAITSFTPKITGTGGVVTISGINFSTANTVNFGGVAATSFNVVNSTTITALVGNGATGNINVATIGGVASIAGFGFITSPIINSFTPTSGPVGTIVTIKGANFNTNIASNTVYFGAVRANISAATQNSLTVTVPVGANYQPITVTTGNKTAYSAFPFLVAFPGGGGTFTATSFAGRADFATAGNPESIATGDLDGDGKPDVVVANTYSNSISIFRNTSTTGSLSFAPKIDSAVGLNPHAVKIADIDADGKLDVILLNYNPLGSISATENTITIFRNTSVSGSISFAARFIIITDYHPQDLAVVDLNLDGKPDLAITHSGTSRNEQEYISVFTNTTIAGNLSFFQVQYFASSSSTLSGLFFENSISVADINNDDKPDLVVGFGIGDFISVMKNKGAIGSIDMNMPYECFGGCFRGTGYLNNSTADFDGDGKIDVITDDKTLRNTSSDFSYSFVNQFTNGRGGILAIDGLSGGLKPDLVRVNPTTNTVSVVRNSSVSGSINFEPNVNYNTGANPKGVATTDFNGDGKIDITVTNKDFNTFSVLLNNIGNTGPAIGSFSPASGNVGTVITITGTNLNGVTSVSIGGVPATSFTLINATTVTAVAGAGNSGNVSITTSAGTSSMGWFYFTPTISSFTPTSAGTGLIVTITGNNFIGATAISFGGVTAASFTVVSPTTIVAVVGIGSSGNVTVTTPAGIVTIPGFTFVVAPTVTSFTPVIGTTGTVVTITGTGFSGATSVGFGATDAATFIVASSTTITAAVGTGSTGNVFVTTPGGTARSINQFFTFVSPPTITSFTPVSGVPGHMITITGTNFTGATAVKFGGTAAASFAIVNSTTITATIANGASGNVSVTTLGGTAVLSGFVFNFATGLPVINSNLDSMIIYPNPSQNSIIISHPSSVRSSTIQIIDMYGRLVKKISPQRNKNKSQLNIQNLSYGVYKVIWSDEKSSYGGILLKN